MSSPLQRILVGSDLSSSSSEALARGAQLARAHGAALRVILVDVPGDRGVGWPLFMSVDWQEARAQHHARLLAQLRAALEAVGAPDAEAHIESGWAPSVLSEQAEAWGADLLVVGAGEHSRASSFFLGSTAEEVLRVARTSVWVVRGSGAAPLRRALVATDFSPHSAAAARFARGVSAQEGASLELIHAWPDPGDGGIWSVAAPEERARYRGEREAEARAALAQAATAAGIATEATRLLAAAQPAQAICDAAQADGADLIVVGSHGQGRIRDLFLGSTAEKILRRAPCSVAVVRA